MLSYKNWKTFNENMMPSFNLGISQPQSMGIMSNSPTTQEMGDETSADTSGQTTDGQSDVAPESGSEETSGDNVEKVLSILKDDELSNKEKAEKIAAMMDGNSESETPEGEAPEGEGEDTGAEANAPATDTTNQQPTAESYMHGYMHGDDDDEDMDDDDDMDGDDDDEDMDDEDDDEDMDDEDMDDEDMDDEDMDDEDMDDEDMDDEDMDDEDMDDEDMDDEDMDDEDMDDEYEEGYRYQGDGTVIWFPDNQDEERNKPSKEEIAKMSKKFRKIQMNKDKAQKKYADKLSQDWQKSIDIMEPEARKEYETWAKQYKKDYANKLMLKGQDDSSYKAYWAQVKKEDKPLGWYALKRVYDIRRDELGVLRGRKLSRGKNGAENEVSILRSKDLNNKIIYLHDLYNAYIEENPGKVEDPMKLSDYMDLPKIATGSYKPSGETAEVNPDGEDSFDGNKGRSGSDDGAGTEYRQKIAALENTELECDGCNKNEFASDMFAVQDPSGKQPTYNFCPACYEMWKTKYDLRMLDGKKLKPLDHGPIRDMFKRTDPSTKWTIPTHGPFSGSSDKDKSGENQYALQRKQDLSHRKPSDFAAKYAAQYAANKNETTEEVNWWNSIHSMLGHDSNEKHSDGLTNVPEVIKPSAGQVGFAPQGRIGWFQ